MDAEFKEFCRQLINRPFPEEHIDVGSFFELPLMYFLENITDVDMMKFYTSVSVQPTKEDDQKQRKNSRNISTDTIGSQNQVDVECYFSTTREFWPKKKELRMESKDSPAGFTKLIINNENRVYFRRKDMTRNRDDGPSTQFKLISKSNMGDMLFNVSHQMNSDVKMDGATEALKNASLVGDFMSDFEDTTMDWVDCIHCQVWPESAKEWICRERQYGWPPPDMIETIVNDGCFLVSKPHPNHPGDDQFRFSFSKAELNLIHSWTNVQKHIYHILRLIKSDVAKKCGGKDACHLKTYHFKTLMFWSCENNPPDFWELDNLVTSLKALLCTMIEWLIEKDCRSYFISTYNLWDYLPDDWEFETEAESILYASENVQTYVCKTAHLFKQSVNRGVNETYAFVPNKLFFILQMRFYHAHVLNPLLPGRQKYGVTHALHESDYVRSKFVSLYEALCRHNFIVSETVESSLKRDIVEEILLNLKQFREVSFEGITELQTSPCDNGHHLIRRFLHIPLNNKEQNCEFKHYTNDDVLILKARPVLQGLIEHLNGLIDNPFLILSYAYEANFHYTGFVGCSDFKEHCQDALKLCEKGLKLCSKLKRKQPAFAISVIPELLPVILTKKWLNIFDKHIVAALKSYFSSTEEFENSKFVIHIDPKHFLKYVRLQCMRILGNSFDDEREMKDVRNNNEPNPTTDILLRALANSRR